MTVDKTQETVSIEGKLTKRIAELEAERDALVKANSDLVLARDHFKHRCEVMERRNRELMTETWSELQMRIGLLKQARDTLAAERETLLKRVEDLQAEVSQVERD